jgi:hypothetical protein
MADVALTQELWIYRGQVRGLTNLARTIFSVVPGWNERPCIFVKNHITAPPLLELCSSDTIMVRITGGGDCELNVASAYLPPS